MSVGGAQIAEERPPYVRFVRKAVEDRAASLELGTYRSKDVDYALITPQGSKDCIERVANDWLKHLKKEVDNKRFPAQWLHPLEESYQAFKEGREAPVNGTPISNWNAPSPAQLDALRSMKILTVEDMAAANEDVIRRLSMGGRQLKDLAVNFLLAQQKDGPAKLAADIVSRDLQLETLRAQVQTLQERNAQLAATLQAIQGRVPEAPPPQASISTSDLFDEPSQGTFAKL